MTPDELGRWFERANPQAPLLLRFEVSTVGTDPFVLAKFVEWVPNSETPTYLGAHAVLDGDDEFELWGQRGIPITPGVGARGWCIFSGDRGVFEVLAWEGPYIALTPSGGIPARLSLTVGKATCELYYASPTDVLTGCGYSEAVSNTTAEEVPGDSYIQAKRDAFGRLLADLWDC